MKRVTVFHKISNGQPEPVLSPIDLRSYLEVVSFDYEPNWTDKECCEHAVDLTHHPEGAARPTQVGDILKVDTFKPSRLIFYKVTRSGIEQIPYKLVPDVLNNKCECRSSFGDRVDALNKSFCNFLDKLTGNAEIVALVICLIMVAVFTCYVSSTFPIDLKNLR